MMQEQRLFRSQHDGGGSRSNETAERPEIRGSLEHFLRDDFLGRAAATGIITSNDAAKIPAIVNEVLVSLIPPKGEATPFVALEAISSVPRTIAWKALHGVVPVGSWECYAYLRNTAEKLSESGNEELQKFAKSYTEISVDLDVKVIGMQHSTPLAMLADRIAEAQGVSVNTDGEIKQFSYTRDGYIVDVFAGRSPTSPIEILKIYFRDPDSYKELFHIDVTRAGGTEDKRAGETTYIQDTCVARFENVDGNIQYTMTRDAVEALRHQDIFNSMGQESGILLEIFLRGLRQNLLPAREHIILRNGEALRLPRFDLLLPLFVSAVSKQEPSLFGLRRTLSNLLLRGNIDLPYENEKQMRQLQQITFDCLTFDPYTTIQALRDSGIALAIPGLRRLSRSDWDNILTSLDLMMDLAERGTVYPKASERTFEVMAAQRARYLGREGDRHFDGVNRFMHALWKVTGYKKKGSDWEEYEQLLHLWEKPKGAAYDVTVIPSIQLPSDISVLRIKTPSGKRFFVTKEDGTVGPDDIEELLEMSRNEQSLLPEFTIASWRDRVDLALRTINGNSHDERISHAYSRERKTDEQILLLHSIGTLAAILRLTPAGVTAQELEEVYISTREESPIVPFNQAFYRLKLVGVVKRTESMRVNKHGVVVPMMLYNWKNPHVRTDLSSISVRRNLLPFYGSVVENINLRSASVSLIDNTLVRLQENHMQSAEVVESLSPDEDGQQFKEEHREQLIADIRTLQLALKKQHEESDEW